MAIQAMTKGEKEVLRNLLDWDESQRPRDSFLNDLCLAAAGLLIIGAALATLANLQDTVIFGVLVPGFVVGLLLVGVWVLGRRRLRERHELARLIRRLEAEG
jgi:hypothetical protein